MISQSLAMEFEYWWLLVVPLFFGLGWLAARIDIGHLLTESRSVPASYFKGLNFLLNEQPDKAIEAFIEVATVGNETADVHFALGGLFRRRGEVERAIRMHQSLLEREELGQEQKLMALYELAQDYLKAGLLDRAEQLFSKLLDSPYSKQALKFLLEIYVQEKDWLKAIEMARQLDATSNQPQLNLIAQLYCELGLRESVHSNSAAAREHLQQALTAYRKSVRANILLGDMEAAEGRHDAAIQYWIRVEAQSPAHLSLVAERLIASYRSLGKMEEGLNLLRGFLERHYAMDVLNVVYQATLESQGPAEAYRLARDEMRRNPTLLGLDRLLEAQLLDVPRERRQDTQLIKGMIHQYTKRLLAYQCTHCGFRAKQYYWHCPACGHWDSYPPQRSEE